LVSRIQGSDGEVVIELEVGSLVGLADDEEEDPLGRAAADQRAPALVTRGDHPWQAWRSLNYSLDRA